MRKTTRLFAIGWLLVLIGGLLAHFIQTAGGIRIQDVRFTGLNGRPMSALLYLPPKATNKTPAPGILAVHGYINSRETQSGFAIEYARRGYVVLALDQTGHGYSGGTAFSDGFGGPAGLKYLRDLDLVDVNNIGLEGHSMGGGAILAAAKAYPEGYRSMVLEGSATNTLFSPPGNASFPRNLAVVYSKYDEFSRLMWGIGRAADVANSAKLQHVFGVNEAVKVEHLYGSIENGTARILYTPVTTHPGDHFSTVAIGDSIDWFARTLHGGAARSHDDQIWMWKELGTLIALFGFVCVVLGTFDMLLTLPAFASLNQPAVPARERRDAKWWLAFAFAVLVPVVSFYYFMDLGAKWLPASKWFPQSITNQIVVWALLNAVITLIFGALFKSRQSRSALRWRASIGIALASVGVGYLSLLLADYFFTIDFRIWVVALKLLSVDRFVTFLVYLVPFTLCYIIAMRALHGFLSIKGESPRLTYTMGVGALALGFALFIIAEYLPLFVQGHLMLAGTELNTIISIQFLPLTIVLAFFSVFTWRRTGSYLPGALMSGLFVTWYIVAGTAMHVR